MNGVMKSRFSLKVEKTGNLFCIYAEEKNYLVDPFTRRIFIEANVISGLSLNSG